MPKITPLMQQYKRLKNAYKDAILLFQMGDFYECFYEDAKILAKELGITLTSREKGENAPPMAGFPIKALDTYLPKLVEKGYKVAVANQVEDPRQAKGLVERKVVEVVTAGTITTDQLLTSKKHNFVMAVVRARNWVYFAFGDLLSLQAQVGKVALKDIETLKGIIQKFSIKEVIVLDSNTQLINALKDIAYLVPVAKSVTPSWAAGFLKERLGEKLFGAGNLEPAQLVPLALLIEYFEEYKQSRIEDFTIKQYAFEDILHIDPTTFRNLDIFENSLTKSTQHSLLGVIDFTLTPMGGRLIREWLLKPLRKRQEIEARLDNVEELVKGGGARVEGIRRVLSNIYDIERLAGLAALKRIKPRQVVMLANSLRNVLELLDLVNVGKKRKSILKNRINQILELIETYLVDDPASTIGEGAVINPAVNPKLGELRQLVYNTSNVLDQMLQEERQKTGLEKLKIGFNKVFGYYFEVPKTKAHLLPEYFIRKQTLVNAERFITPKLKELEEKIFSAQEQMFELEQVLYAEFLDKLHSFVSDLLEISSTVAYWDTIASLAYVALRNNYTRPRFLEPQHKKDLHLVDSRHPVVEQFTPNFVKNSITLEKDTNFVILTGPNMGGKSTFIRQVALLQIMAQIGSFVPAKEAEFKIRDKIFARVGASDDITTGRSTFMVEMAEVSYIINNATPNSLIILDEIGRGTSTHEGFALAYAISKYIKEKIGAPTFFATHFHELTRLEDEHPGFVNYKVDVLEEKDNVYFLYTVSRGRATKSYGLYVAQLVGLPKSILKTAQEVLLKLMKGSTLYNQAYDSVQLSLQDAMLFMDSGSKGPSKAEQVPPHIKEVVDKLKELDINNITPLQALQILQQLKNKVGSPNPA